MTFDEFAGARLQAVLRFATALSGDPDLAKDLVQEVLIRASGRWQKIGQLERPEAYVRKMVVNEYLSWRRRSWRLIPSGMSSHIDQPPLARPCRRIRRASGPAGRIGQAVPAAAHRTGAPLLRGLFRRGDR